MALKEKSLRDGERTREYAIDLSEDNLRVLSYLSRR